MKPLKIIFRKSLIEGYVSKFGKDVNVTPIHTKGSRTLTVNYRSVSLTSLVCRILEELITNNLSEFFEKEDLIATKQNGFVRRKAYVTNLLKTIGSDHQILDR